MHGVTAFVAQVPLRWTDQDSYRHLNHARAVTLLEEARIALFFDRAAADGVGTFSSGLLVVGLGVEYKRQVAYRAHTLRVAMTVEQVRAATFVIRYALHDGPGDDAPVAITAHTRMAPFDLAAQRPRRLTDDEKSWLGEWA
ncbi:thioesterase family protein [Pseudonocardia petroleophila]